MGSLHVTVLIEDLARLAAAVPARLRFPSLERVWSRGTPCRLQPATPNHLRFGLFGIEPADPLPVAALSQASNLERPPNNDCYWLRLDPVTLWADMARVFMTRYGFADLDVQERNEIETCVRDVLLQEGIRLQGEQPDRWCVALQQPLDFEFTPLDEALGMDFAEALPERPEARYWRRVLTEIQVALHNAPVNQRRRAAGKTEINSVWFWGGGFLPRAAPNAPLDTVYADSAVSRGLAIIGDRRLKRLAEASTSEFSDDGNVVLIDWTGAEPGPEARLSAADSLLGRLLERADRGRLALTVYDGSGDGRRYTTAARYRWWRRRKPLAAMLDPAGQE